MLKWDWSGPSTTSASAIVHGFANGPPTEQKALIALFDTQDQIAQEVVQRHARLEAATAQVAEAEQEVKESLISFGGNLRGLGEPRGVGDSLQLIIRPQEAVASLQQLNQAYEDYFRTVTAYNQAEFQLYHALARISLPNPGR